MQHLARRLNWLHAFTRLERWKEELLLVNEEIRRLKKWYMFYIELNLHEAQSNFTASADRSHQGFRAALYENARLLKLAYSSLPNAIKSLA